MSQTKWRMTTAVLIAAVLILFWITDPLSLRGRRYSNTIGPRAISILKSASRVEVFRVSPEPQEAGGNNIAGYPITAVGKDQGQDFAARLTAILLGQGVTQNQKKCGLEPGIAFRLWADNEAVEVLICFNCDVLWPRVVGEKVEKPHYQWQDFDPVRSELVKLAKEVFPDDQEIQSLQDSRRR